MLHTTMIPAESYIRALVLIGLEDFCNPEHGDFRALLKEVGIPEKALQNLDDLISFRAVAALLETVAHRHHITNLGLAFSKRSAPTFTQLGPSILMASFVSNIREWQETAIRYWSFHTNGFGLQPITPEARDVAILRIHMNALTMPARQITETIVANIVGITRVITNELNSNPLVVRFQHHKPADIAEHIEFFGCPLEFGCDHIEIEFEKRVLDLPTSGSAKIFKPLMRLYVSERIRRMHLFNHSASSTVALSITSLLGSGNCSLDAVADSLGSNTKTLQRQLTKESTSFSILLQQVRENMARHLLVETDAPVSHVAGLLDYSTTAPFTTAFERWTGATPLRFRQQERRKRKNAVPGLTMAVDV